MRELPRSRPSPRTLCGSSFIGLLGLAAPALASKQVAERADAAVAASCSIVGRCLLPDGAPARGAVVTTSAGGFATTAADGAFRIELELDAGVRRAKLDAFATIGAATHAASAMLDALLPGATVASGTHVLRMEVGCQPDWIPSFGGLPGVDGNVNASAVFDDGNGSALFIGGSFTSAAGVPARRIARWDGESFSPLDPLDGTVHAFAVFDDGSGRGPALYAGGAFQMAGGVQVRGVARWDGANWEPLGSGVYDGFAPGSVQALAVFDDGSGGGPALYAAGDFQSAGGVSASCIARWNGASWSPLAGGTDVVRALAVFDDGLGGGPALYAGGYFTTANGLPAAYVARWDGATWSALGGGTNNDVLAFSVFDDGGGPALFAGGAFTAAGGQPASRIARWDGLSWAPLGAGVGGKVSALLVRDDGSGAGPALYVGGDAPTVRRWDGSSWSLLPGSFDGPVMELIAYGPPGEAPALFAGGAFDEAGGTSAANMASWDGSSWKPLVATVGAPVLALAVFDDGTGPALYAGGEFISPGGVPALHVARFDGTSWSALGAGLSHPVRSLAVFDDGGGPALYAGGEFTSSGGALVFRVARWDGASWSPLGSGMDDDVRALAVFDDGNGPALYAGGFFQMAGGVAASRVARWDGTAWSKLGAGVDGAVFALAPFAEGGRAELYVGGSFVNAGGTSARRIARWDGASWAPLGSGMSGTGAVAALASFDDGGGPALFAAGTFTSAGGVPAHNVARWRASSWSALGDGLSTGANSLAVFDDGRGDALYVGGTFGHAGGIASNKIARWDGARWSSLGTETNGTVLALAAQSGGSGAAPALYAGGLFTVSPAGDSHLARFGCAPASPGGPFCSGDGSSTPCPCGNSGESASGCDNSAGTGGVRLDATGDPAANDVVLHADGFAPSSSVPALLVRSTSAASPPSPFGDGLLCLRPPITRLGVHVATGGALSISLDHDAGSGTFHYQVWYRDSAPYCTSATYNLSNGYRIDWP